MSKTVFTMKNSLFSVAKKFLSAQDKGEICHTSFTPGSLADSFKQIILDDYYLDLSNLVCFWSHLAGFRDHMQCQVEGRSAVGKVRSLPAVLLLCPGLSTLKFSYNH